MKNYYYNPKTRDLTIFDTDTKEMLVLERIEGIRVLTSSEIDSPVKTEPVKKWSNSVWDPASGKAGYKGQRRRKVAKAEKKAGKRSGRWTCKNCGEKGHSAKTCKNPPKVAPPQLPESEIQEIAREERREENA